jgi:hypothetical protein
VNFGLLVGLTRARVALIVMGLAWLVGLTPGVGMRCLLGALVLVALAFDGLLDEQRIARHSTKTEHRDRYRTTA